MDNYNQIETARLPFSQNTIQALPLPPHFPGALL